MSSSYALRAFQDGDAAEVDELGLTAFDQFLFDYWNAPQAACTLA
jgi:hypothetical protein